MVIWFKSSHSSESANCVEVAYSEDGILVRDSKNPEGPTLSYRLDTWRNFIEAVASGELDKPW
jgi:hypothetical protein